MDGYQIALQSSDIEDMYKYVDALISQNKIKRFKTKSRSYAVYKFRTCFSFCIWDGFTYNASNTDCYIRPYLVCESKYELNIFQDTEVVYNAYCNYTIPKQIINSSLFIRIKRNNVCIIKQKYLREIINAEQLLMHFISIFRCVLCSSENKFSCVLCRRCIKNYKIQIINKTIAIYHGIYAYVLFPVNQDITNDLIAIYYKIKCNDIKNYVAQINLYPFIIV